jgi:hypothetical protein
MVCEHLFFKSTFPTMDMNALRKPNRFILSNVSGQAPTTSPSERFYHYMTTSYRLPGLSHLDNFIVTRKSCPLTGPDSYGIAKTHANTDRQQLDSTSTKYVTT